MPARILKDCVGFCSSLLTKFLIVFLEKEYFPNQLKLKEVTLVIKKDYELRKKNYRPVRVLSYASKIFEKLVFNQMNLFFATFNRVFQESKHTKSFTKYDRKMDARF